MMRLRVSSIPLAMAALAFAPAAFAAGTVTSGEYGSFSVDATVLHEATPDLINFNVSCEVQNPLSRQQIRQELAAKQQEIQSLVGTNGQVRRSGSPTVYPFYEAAMEVSSPDAAPRAVSATAQRFTGNYALVVRNVKKDAANRISDGIEDIGCGVTWDVRLIRTASYARQYRTELMEQIDEKKAVFEEILGKKLDKVSNMSIWTSVDYGYYGGSSALDPETLTVPATTTLNMTFEFGEGEKAPVR